MKRAKQHGGFPEVVYVAQHDDHGTRYFIADKAPEALVTMGEKTKLARYLFSGLVPAEGVVKLGDDK